MLLYNWQHSGFIHPSTTTNNMSNALCYDFQRLSLGNRNFSAPIIILGDDHHIYEPIDENTVKQGMTV